jgi:terminase small subunit-like protein
MPKGKRAEAKANPVGRPSDYGPDIAAHICAEIAAGKSMREICRADGMPDMRTVFRWLAAHAEFCQQYARAREAQADYMAEEILEIADDATNDWTKREDGSDAVNTEVVQRSRLRVDARKWLMAKLQPKKYGDRIAQEVTGGDGLPLVPVLNVTISDLTRSAPAPQPALSADHPTAVPRSPCTSGSK